MIQSTDKNFLVPVGGAIVASPSVTFIAEFSAMYPGRAGMAPVMDLFITLLSMGERGYRGLLTERIRLVQTLTDGLSNIARKFGESVILSPRNSISIGVSLASLDVDYGNVGAAVPILHPTKSVVNSESSSSDVVKGGGSDVGGGDEKQDKSKAESSKSKSGGGPTFLGAMLFQRCVSGCRVIQQSAKSTFIGRHEFVCWGAHTSSIPSSYFTAACSIGLCEGEIVEFLKRLDQALVKISKPRAVFSIAAASTTTSTESVSVVVEKEIHATEEKD